MGDDDQSIYGWRGAEVGNILRFEQDMAGARVIRLERNYRSTGRILAAASGLIAKNSGRLGKTLWTAAEEGEPVRLRGLWDGEAEARFVGEEIEALQRKGHALAEIAILVRTGAQTREFEERFITLGLPYRVVGGAGFYERMEIRDALAYLRVLHQPDDSLAFERIVNKPKRGLGDATLRVLHGHARARRIPLIQAAREVVESDELRPAARRALADLLLALDRWRALEPQTHHAELAQIVLEESGYTQMWMNDKSADAPGRLENLKELITALEEFENLAGFLEHVSLVMDTMSESNAQDQINLMTLHAAKGLEFETVFLPGWEEGLFPNQRAMDDGGLRGLEEERRLAHVGLTRARQRAIVSLCRQPAPARLLERRGAVALHRRAAGRPDRAGERSRALRLGRRRLPGQLRRLGPAAGQPGHGPDARERAGQGGRFIDVLPSQVATRDTSAAFPPADRVFHTKFGYGTVRHVEGERLTIAFDKAGEKKVMASFVVPEDQAG